MIIIPIKTRVFKARESLADFIISEIPKLKDKSILVVTSKIVALSQGRVVENYSGREEEKMEWIRRESEKTIKNKWTILALKDNSWCSSAGIDESNAQGKLILLPKNSFSEAEKLGKILIKHYKIKKLGIVISDSRNFPLRLGAMGVALGYSGFLGLKSYVGKKDIFGRKFKFERVNVADSLASVAMLDMGEGNEKMPLAVIENAPVDFIDKKTNSKELFLDPKDDIYRVLFEGLGRA